MSVQQMYKNEHGQFAHYHDAERRKMSMSSDVSSSSSEDEYIDVDDWFRDRMRAPRIAQYHKQMPLLDTFSVQFK